MNYCPYPSNRQAKCVSRGEIGLAAVASQSKKSLFFLTFSPLQPLVETSKRELKTNCRPPQAVASVGDFSAEIGSDLSESGRFPIGNTQAASDVIEITAATITKTCTKEK